MKHRVEDIGPEFPTNPSRTKIPPGQTSTIVLRVQNMLARFPLYQLHAETTTYNACPQSLWRIEIHILANREVLHKATDLVYLIKIGRNIDI